MIEKLLEDKVAAKVAARGLSGLSVTTGFGTASAGSVKGLEDGATACLAIQASSRKYETFTLPMADIEIECTLYVRSDVCPTGAEVLTYCEPLAEIFDAWQKDCDLVISDFTVTGFAPAGLIVSGGDGLMYDQTDDVWQWRQSVTLRGAVG